MGEDVAMANSPLISVVIPVGPGHEQYLDTAIASIQTQTIPRDWIETIVVQDPDGQGAGWARNEGLARATAPLISWLDADDYYVPTALDALLRGYAHYPDAYVYGDWWDAWDDTRIEYRLSASFDRMAHFRGGIHVVSTLAATEDIRSIGGFLNLKGWEDWDFWCRMTIAGLCGVRISAPIIVYRITHGFRRNKSYEMQGELKAAHLAKYIRYLNGEEPLMACCTGAAAAKAAAQRAIALLGIQGMEFAMTTNTDIRLEYVGQNRGPKSFTALPSRTKYDGARNGTNQFVNAAPEDAGWLINTGLWRQVPRMPDGGSAPPPVPHLILENDPSASAPFGDGLLVPIDGVASPAPVIQFADPPEIEASLEDYPEVSMVESAKADRAIELASATTQKPGSPPKTKNPRILE